MVKYNKEFKEQALLFSDEIGVKKAAEQLGISYYTIADWRKVRSRKPKEERIASDKTPFNERELAMQREIQELKKANEGRSRFFRRRPEEVSTQGLFSYILENAKEKMWSIVKLCRTLNVSETGFYKWKRNRAKMKHWQLLEKSIIVQTLNSLKCSLSCRF